MNELPKGIDKEVAIEAYNILYNDGTSMGDYNASKRRYLKDHQQVVLDVMSGNMLKQVIIGNRLVSFIMFIASKYPEIAPDYQRDKELLEEFQDFWCDTITTEAITDFLTQKHKQ